jgi:hypothetical protein
VGQEINVSQTRPEATLRVVGEKYVGRYRIDVPGSTKQVKKAVSIGNINEMTKPEADRKLLELIEREGVNTQNTSNARAGQR